ncbi:MAG: TRAP transporter substrate-binding protein [Hydrogenophaga sp.]|jgi:TRAP-type mannitol/chloroaromatic compound transport system substrate-binding protein|uniref:TRAP transporter substrate-binding protein n=1 Tax=Hydrogenophaga sp. TaxID=1904254 RepID=UPI0027240051|nr:TRAP transporter substrate-binding protein [Hydrogenophaga sp.]MDO9479981.1 TRAP transporter substrate-binding protein [Hydrogenophaga sp.]MDO9569942.1 TRAP transporter substrate-binding protein [Hydrogenophaga sp.]MDP2096492.1 TRAP transporter substrate-binding protein [Hydrogenophaga sp.]MDP3346175.1 TRAP transporter substrate-binding protein [Hydrogenophaga sp.]MDP3376368.1 TRAP transporter substrate-binding protein [Hydrogenophaga sp.]
MKYPLKALALAASMVAMTLPATAQETVRWGIPMAFGSNLTALGDTMPWVSEQLKKVSGGTVNLQVFEPGKLVPALGIFDAVSSGKVEAGYSFMGYELGKVPVSAIFGALPFGMETPQFSAWMYFGGGDALLKEAFKPHNVYPIFCGSISPEAAGWFRKEINSPDDLKGLKFRAAALGGKIYQKLGASVTMLPGGELFQALEKGVLDGTEFSLPTVDDQLGFSKVAKHYYLPGWHQPSTNQFLYVNMAAWNKLKPQTQAQIETTCTAGVTMAISKAEALQGEALAKFEREGVKLHQFNKTMLDAFAKASKDVLAEESAKDPMFKKVYDSMSAFQNKNRAWHNLGYLPRDHK